MEADLSKYFLHQALLEAQSGASTGAGGPFGCVIVRDGQIVGRGHNEVLLSNDPTAHAEVVAIRDACKALGQYHLGGCTVYATCEPCPMCLGAIYWAQPARLVFACTREDAAAIGFNDALIYQELTLSLENRLLPSEHLPVPEIEAFMKHWQEPSPTR
ncbi:MAG: nucleoside deaminase [Haliscomenobacter sp.]|nr:nucleoside deaminase [Haliscomenobacter sp.]